MAATTTRTGHAGRWNFAAAFAGWLLPGLGQFLLGQPKRGVILAISIGTLWLGGLLIGGISIVDRNNHPAWFLGQMLIAPSLAANYYQRQLLADQVGPPHPDRDPPFTPAIGRADEQGTLFTCMAGLLNLLAILDVLYREPQRLPPPPVAKDDPPS